MNKTIIYLVLVVVITGLAILQGQIRIEQKNFNNCLTYFDHLPLHEIKPLCQDILDGIKKTDPFEDPEIHR